MPRAPLLGRVYRLSRRLHRALEKRSDEKETRGFRSLAEGLRSQIEETWIGACGDPVESAGCRRRVSTALWWH